MVTHDLRTPLSVVRVYVDLLADAADVGGRDGRGPGPGADATVEAWREAADDQLARLDRQVDSILVSVRGDGLTGPVAGAIRCGLRPSTTSSRRCGCCCVRIRSAGSGPSGSFVAVGDEARFRQVLEQLLENESKYAPSAEGVSIGIWRLGDEVQVYVTDDGPGRPDRGLGERLRALRPGRRRAVAAAGPGSGCSRHDG